MPAHVSANVPAVSLAPLVGLRSPNSDKTIPFKNVLGAFETPDQENVSDSGEQKPNPQGTTSKQAPPDMTPEQPRAPQYSAPQYVPPQQSVAQILFSEQPPATITAERPAEETAESQPDAPVPEDWMRQESAPSAISRPTAEPVEQDHTGSRLTGITQRLEVRSSTSPMSLRVTAPTTVRFAMSDQHELAPTNFTVDKSPTQAPSTRASLSTHPSVLPTQTSALRALTPASPVQASVPPEHAVSMDTPVRDVTPAATISEDRTQAVRTTVAAMVPSQPKSAPLASSRQVPAATAPLAQAHVANPQASNKSQVAAARPPQNVKTSVSESVSGESGKSAPAQALATTAKPEVAPRTLDLHTTTNAIPKSIAIAPPKATPFPAPSEQTLQASSAPTEVQQHRAAVQTEKTATARSAQASISPKPQETDSRRIVSANAAPSNSPQTQVEADAPKQTARSINNAATETSANVTQAPPLESTVATPDIPEPAVAPRGKAGDISVAPPPPTRIATTVENFAFAARMLPTDITPAHELPMANKSPLTPAETPVSQAKMGISQPKPATPQSQQTQSEPSSNSKHETQSPTPAERPDARVAKATEVTQPEPTQSPITHWSEVSTPQMPEAAYGRSAPELVEASPAGQTLNAQETHLVTPELPKTSTSTEILLHLTGNDQSAAAIRIADRAGSVSVSVHASDPVLRESLRTNLGELSNQLGQQGWKAEMLKPAVLAAQSESQQDSHAGGQQSSQQQQQHSSDGERQSQRDRRTPSGNWQQELEQQISSGNAHAGGNG